MTAGATADKPRSAGNTPRHPGTSIGANMNSDTETHHAVRNATMVTAADRIQTLAPHQGKPVKDRGWQMDGSVKARTCGPISLACDDARLIHRRPIAATRNAWRKVPRALARP